MDVGRKALILARLLGYPGRALADGGRVAGAQVGPRASRCPNSSSGSRSSTPAGAGGCAAAAEAAGAALRRDGDAVEDRGRAPRRCRSRARSRRIKGSDNQLVFTTARYKANPLVITGPGAGRRGDGRRRAERHPPAGRRMSAAGPSPPSRPAAWATWARASTSSASRWPARATRSAPSGPATRGIRMRDPGHPEPPARSRPAHFGARRARGARRRGRAARRRARHRALGAEGAAALGRPGRERGVGRGRRRGGERAARERRSTAPALLDACLVAEETVAGPPPRQHRALAARRHRAHPLHGPAGHRARSRCPPS